MNPEYDAIEGLRCHPDLASLTERADMALLDLASPRVEAAFEDVVAAAVGSVLPFDQLHIEGEAPGRAIVDRLRDRAPGFSISARAASPASSSPPRRRRARSR